VSKTGIKIHYLTPLRFKIPMSGANYSLDQLNFILLYLVQSSFQRLENVQIEIVGDCDREQKRKARGINHLIRYSPANIFDMWSIFPSGGWVTS
jgi:hypothetical protein